MASDAHKVVATAGLISVGVGSANSVIKNQRPPSSRFLIGSGVAFLVLSALADVSPDLAKGLSIGVASTVILGEGGGVLSYVNGRGEMDTAKRKKPAKPATPTRATSSVPVTSVTVIPSNGFRPDHPTAIPGMRTPTGAHAPYNR